MKLIPGQCSSSLPAATDWIGVSKVLVLEISFVATMLALLTGHGNTEIVSLAWALGGTLGLLRIGDVAANVINVKSYLSAPAGVMGGVVPQAANTPLMAAPTVNNGGTTNASPTAT